MTDTDFDGLLLQLNRLNWQVVVDSLMRGNDTQRFTTRQAAERYFQLNNKPSDDAAFDKRYVTWLVSITPNNLKRRGCIEVEPGIWSTPCTLTSPFPAQN